ncbi:MAG: carbon-nitrogen hydrolase family protein [Candidatus Bipolaricaulia bacterium]
MKLHLGTGQFRPARGQIEENLQRAGQLLEECAAQGAELVVLPELFNTGYFWDEELQELIAQGFHETVAWLKRQAAARGMEIVAGVGEPAEGEFYDSALLVRPSGKVEIYRKTHLFRDEVKYFQAGNRLSVAEIEGAKLKLGMLICVEVGFPELARALALDGAELIALPMAFGAARGKIYETATRARAIENNLFIITANQVGRSGEFAFYGHSRAVSPLGEVLLDLGTEEGCGVVELDFDLVNRCRRGEVDEAYPYLRERRPELYRPVAQP